LKLYVMNKTGIADQPMTIIVKCVILKKWNSGL